MKSICEWLAPFIEGSEGGDATPGGVGFPTAGVMGRAGGEAQPAMDAVTDRWNRIAVEMIQDFSCQYRLPAGSHWRRRARVSLSTGEGREIGR